VDLLTQRLDALDTLLAPPGTGALQTAQNRLRAAESLLEGAPARDITSTTESYGTGLAASYEVDLWGRIRADIAAARYEMEASREDLHAAMESIAAQVVLTWLDLIEARQELELVQRQLESNRTTLELVELRRAKGLASALDVFQQRQAVAGREAILPVLELRIESLHYQIALLLGKTPQQGPRMETQAYAPLGPLPETGLPSDLLARRPDVRAAGLRLQAADWAVAAARADRLPSLRLSAGVDLTGNAVDDLFDDWLARLAASVTGPVFDGGRRKAAVERARAVVDERLAAYKRVVVTAIFEVADALLRETKQRELIAALEVQYDAARQTHEEALTRYRKGLNDYLPVLNALTNMQNLERELLQEERTLRFERVQIALALGGSWMEAARAQTEESIDP
jgi:NodT family efflux transporter outer membrane factor (OMF) lipoprotein